MATIRMGKLAVVVLGVLAACAASLASAWVVEETPLVTANAATNTVVVGDRATYAYCALSEFRMNGIGKCTVAQRSEDGAWTVSATGTTSFRIECRAACLREDGRTEAVFTGVLRNPLAFPDMGSANDTLLCALSHVYLGSNYMGMVGGTCDTYVDNDGNWTVTYFQSTSYTECAGVCLRPVVAPTVRQWLSGPYQLQVNGEMLLGSTDTLAFCALSTTRFGGFEEYVNDCAVFRRDGNWYLQAEADQLLNLRCRAYCLNAEY